MTGVACEKDQGDCLHDTEAGLLLLYGRKP